MTKGRNASAMAGGLDALKRTLTWTAETLARIAGRGIDAAVHGLGLVSDQDLHDIDTSLERVENRLARLEARQRARMARAVKSLDAVGEDGPPTAPDRNQ